MYDTYTQRDIFWLVPVMWEGAARGLKINVSELLSLRASLEWFVPRRGLSLHALQGRLPHLPLKSSGCGATARWSREQRVFTVASSPRLPSLWYTGFWSNLNVGKFWTIGCLEGLLWHIFIKEFIKYLSLRGHGCAVLQHYRKGHQSGSLRGGTSARCISVT